MTWFDIRRRFMLFLLRFKDVVTAVILTLTKGTGLPLVSFKATGNSTQASAPTPAAPVIVNSTGDKVLNTDSDWNTPIAYGKTSWVGTAPSAVGADCYRVPIKVSGKNQFDGQWEAGSIDVISGANITGACYGL